MNQRSWEHSDPSESPGGRIPVQGDSAEQEFGVFPGFGSWEWHLELMVQISKSREVWQERAPRLGSLPNHSQELQEHLRGFLQNPDWGGQLQKTPQASATSSCHLLSLPRSLEPQLGLDAAVSTSGSPGSSSSSCRQLDRDRNATLELSTRLDVQNANKTPNHSVCCSSQTKHS